MQKRLPLLLLIALLTACAPAAPQSLPTTAPQPPESTLLSPVHSSPASTGNVTVSKVVPTYEMSVPAILWDTKARAHHLLPIEPSTGESVPGYEPVLLGVNYYYAFSPDRKTLVVLGYESDNLRNPILRKIDLASWRETLIPLDVTGWVGGLTFSPDGRFVAVGFNHSTGNISILDMEKGATLVQAAPNFEISRLKYTSDGSALMAYGRLVINRFTANEQTSGFARAALFDTQTLDLQWSAEVEGVREGIYPSEKETSDTTDLHANPENAIYLYPGSVFAPDSDSLYIVHADEDKLTTINFNARTINTVAIQPKLSLLERILLLTSGVVHAKVTNGTSRSAVISADGGTIYTVGWRSEATTSSNGDLEFTQTPLGLKAIDARDGTILFNFATRATDVKMMPEDGGLLLQSWNEVPFSDLLDTKKVSVVSHFENAVVFPAYRMSGEPLLVSSVTDDSTNTRMAAYSMDGVLLGDWLANNYGAWLAMP